QRGPGEHAEDASHPRAGARGGRGHVAGSDEAVDLLLGLDVTGQDGHLREREAALAQFLHGRLGLVDVGVDGDCGALFRHGDASYLDEWANLRLVTSHGAMDRAFGRGRREGHPARGRASWPGTSAWRQPSLAALVSERVEFAGRRVTEQAGQNHGTPR